MFLLDDILSGEDQSAIERVISSDSPRFDLLVKVAGLDPRTDFVFTDLRSLNFCGADLRGFNFTGSDLRKAIRNKTTLIDETTIFVNAKVEWIDAESLPIVAKMQEIEAAVGSERRKFLLGELTTEFGRSTHVVTFLVAAAASAATLDDFLDFALFLPSSPTVEQSRTLSISAQKLLKKKLAQSKRRTGRDKTAIFAVEKITDRLKMSRNSLGESIYNNLAEIVNSKHETVALKGMASIDFKDLEAAFIRIGS